MNSRYDIVIVGGGIVGLATALALRGRLPSARLVVLEKESDVGTHQTGHNSGVIHSGIYYRPGSHKARLCVEGGRLLGEFCARHDIPVARCGKLIVARNESELARLEDLYARGVANGVPGLERMGAARLKEVEPHAAGRAAIHSPATAIVDFTHVVRAMAGEARGLGTEIALQTAVRAIRTRSGSLDVETTSGHIEARYLVNCAGLQADLVAQWAGARPTVRIVPFRGEYYHVRPERRHLVRGLIYPVPDPRFPFLGVHLTRTIHEEVEAGPNAVLAFAREGYTMARVNLKDLSGTLTYGGFWAMAARYWRVGLGEFYRSFRKTAFLHSLQDLVPDLRAEDLIPGGAGVRAQAVTPEGRLADDFHIVESPRAIHVLNAPSPAATASLAIGRYISDLVVASGIPS